MKISHLVLFCIGLSASSQGAAYTLQMDVDPLALGWTFNGGAGSHTVSGSILTIDTSSSYGLVAPAAIFNDVTDETSDWTVEARLKVDAIDHSLGLGPRLYTSAANASGGPPGGQKLFNIWFLENKIQFNNSILTMDTTDAFHIYRYEVLGSSANLYVDGNLALSNVAAIFGATPSFFFGDNAGGGSSLSQWDYVYISTGAVPLPPTLWLFGAGLIGLVGMAKRKKA